MSDLPVADHARNMRLIGYTDQGGRPDGVQVMVNKGYAIVGHMFSQGFSVIDVRDPRNPKPVKYVPAPPNTWTLHLQAHDDLLLVVNAKDLYRDAILQDEQKYYVGSMSDKLGLRAAQDYSAGFRVYDIKVPALRDRLHAGRGRRRASHLVRGRPLGLHVGDARRLQRLRVPNRRAWPTRRAPRSSGATGSPA